jgi:hypothetical protein
MANVLISVTMSENAKIQYKDSVIVVQHAQNNTLATLLFPSKPGTQVTACHVTTLLTVYSTFPTPRINLEPHMYHHRKK